MGGDVLGFHGNGAHLTMLCYIYSVGRAKKEE